MQLTRQPYRQASRAPNPVSGQLAQRGAAILIGEMFADGATGLLRTLAGHVQVGNRQRRKQSVRQAVPALT